MSVGVILTTYGEPRRNSYAEQWMYSYRILRRLTRKIAPIPAPVLPIIATARARGRVRLWARHEFASPLEALHERTVDAVRAELARRGADDGVLVTGAYEFRRPSLADALASLARRGREHAIVVPMYIGAGDFTDGMTRLALEDAQRRLPAWRSRPIDLCPLAEHGREDRLAATLLDGLLAAARSRGVALPAPDRALLLAAHGTVVDPAPGIDNGLRHFARVLVRLKALARPHFGLVRLGWLNHTRGGRWTTPTVADALRHIRARGFDRLVYFPWGFTTDNAETLLEGRVCFDEARPRFESVEHLPCVNTHDAFVHLIADRLCERLARLPSRSFQEILP